MAGVTFELGRAQTGIAARRRVAPSPASLSDGELLRSCETDPELFAEFYRRHSRAVLTYLARRTGCAQTAADLTSETFAAALISRTRFNSRRGDGGAWLIGIARNLLGKYHRREAVSARHRRRISMEPTQLSDDEIAQVDRLIDLDSLRPQLRQALDSLSPSHADAVRLRILEEHSYAETARILGISEGAARVRVSRALTQLADLLGEIR